MRFWLSKKEVWDRLIKKGTRNFNGCLVWQGGINSKKDPYSIYGRITFQKHNIKKSFYVHRLALWIKGELRLNSKFQSCHQCHFTLCFEPEHLKKGTIVDNIKERDLRKKRMGKIK